MDKVVNFEGNGRGEAVEALEDWGTLSQRCTFTNIFVSLSSPRTNLLLHLIPNFMEKL